MGKPTICIGEYKGADQLRSNCEADQRLCFRYSDSTILLLLKSEILIFYLISVLVQLGLCQTCSETTLLVFPRNGSNLAKDYEKVNYYTDLFNIFSHKFSTLILKSWKIKQSGSFNHHDNIINLQISSDDVGTLSFQAWQ